MFENFTASRSSTSQIYCNDLVDLVQLNRSDPISKHVRCQYWTKALYVASCAPALKIALPDQKLPYYSLTSPRDCRRYGLMWAHGTPGMNITWKSRPSLSRADCGQAARRAREELPHSLQLIFSLHSKMRLAQDQLPAPLWKSIFSLPLDLNWLQTSNNGHMKKKILQPSTQTLL